VVEVMDFIAIDFETANADLASICQIGLVRFQDRKAVETWQTLINPKDYFDPFNVSIHGIDEDMVKDAPTFPKIFDSLRCTIEKQLVACHTHFDRVALSCVIEKHQLPQIDCIWLDTARVARRAWGKFSHAGYGLKNVADELGIKFNHHVAGEDARAAGEILLRAIDETGISLDDWLVRVNKPMNLCESKITRKGNPEGPLAGEVVVFTGALSMHRHEAADCAAAMGCEVGVSTNKTTTILVVGDQDIRRLAGHEKSSKHRKAEDLISKGQPIRIIGESDFLRLVNVNIEPTSMPKISASHKKVDVTFSIHIDPSGHVVVDKE
jgi:DNA polymerase-3 subunit epsilon